MRRLPLTYFARGHRPGCGLPRHIPPLPELSHPASEYHVAHFAPLGCTVRMQTSACSPAWSEPAPVVTMPGLLRSTVKGTHVGVNGGRTQGTSVQRRGKTWPPDLHGRDLACGGKTGAVLPDTRLSTPMPSGPCGPSPSAAISAVLRQKVCRRQLASHTGTVHMSTDSCMPGTLRRSSRKPARERSKSLA